jgi:H+-translocating NAD(P) transhydrogenase subunit alpha
VAAGGRYLQVIPRAGHGAPTVRSYGEPVSGERTTVGVPREAAPGERRVALVPATVETLSRAGVDVLIEAGAGDSAGFSDEGYRQKGAKVTGRREVLGADVILHVRGFSAGRSTLDLLRPGQVVIGFFDPLSDPHTASELADREVTALAIDLMPRITRAQAMDALSSQATVGGYKAVLLAARALPRMFPMLTTAAGTIPPARAFVIGAGVAGLQAIATAKRLGAVVEAYDVRAAAREQVESVGARFVELPIDAGASEDKGGYATAQGEDFYRRQRELMHTVVSASDVVITTAAIPGKPAPVLVTKEMVAAMARGSVVVDLAAERGGNCELSQADTVITTDNGVTVLAPTNLAATVPFHASSMYARNISAFLNHLLKDGKVQIDTADEITRETLICRGGVVTNPRVRSALGLEEEGADVREAKASGARLDVPTTGNGQGHLEPSQLEGGKGGGPS